MSYSVDQDQQWLLNCLGATLDVDHGIRTYAETSLQQASLHPGYGAALAKVTINKEIPVGLRQLAAVLLKQYVKEHWQEDSESFIPPVISASEKLFIRQTLILALDDPHGKICTAVGMAVASIAQYDWPENWPDLLPSVLKLISDQNNINGVRGGLRCLALLSDDLDDLMVPKLVPLLFPCLYTVVSSSQIYGKSLGAKALSVVSTCMYVIGSMKSIYKTETKELVRPMVRPWMELFSVLLQSPVPSEDPEDWDIRMEVSKCLMQFIQNFPSLTEPEFSVVLGPLWQTFVSCLPVYVSSSVEGTDDSYSDRIDSDGECKGLDSFVIQLFELLLTVFGHRSFLYILQRNMKELVYHTIGYLQMTEDQLQTWLSNPNQYVADEGDAACSCRVSGILFLEDLVSLLGVDGINVVIEAAEKQFCASIQMRSSNPVGWWKLQEACIYGLCSISEASNFEEVSEWSKSTISKLMSELLITMGTRSYTCFSEHPFLYARAFSAVSKLHYLVSPSLLEKYLVVAFHSIAADAPLVVKIGACRAVSELSSLVHPNILQPHIINILSFLTELLKQMSDESLHVVLEAMQATVRAGNIALSAVEPQLSTILLDMWARHFSDPFICIDFVETLEAIKLSPGCLHPLAYRVLSCIGPVLEQHRNHPGMVAASLDVLCMLLKNAPADIVKAAFDVCFSHVIAIVLKTDDHTEAQNATECLAAFVFGGKQDLLKWSGDPDWAVNVLFVTASRLLDPNVESSVSLFVGTYILQLILHMTPQMAQHLEGLAAALVRRLQSCTIAGLRSSLLLVFARLVHLSSSNLDNLINILIALPTEGHPHALAYVMSEWTKHQGEIQGAYAIKVTTSALALLLSSQQPELGRILVQGHLVKASNGITTRSKAKVAPDRWTLIPLPAKILALLADMLIELDEQHVGNDDEDSDWEDDDDNVPASKHMSANSAPGTEEDICENSCDNFLELSDPLNKINLSSYVREFLLHFHANNMELFNQLSQSLTMIEKNALEGVV